ncbi:activator-dependent family glycosyltransferase [Amycolatopsis sp. cmx-4-68]|uniref:activator-dependent family glycosyltransferase n=1 Tax=Amycolatopsis sp. cmx-4-68 TaxID=2790938 RepID=UPI00397CBEBB
MRVVFVVIPVRSHLNLLAPMAWALHVAGHEVRVASGPELQDVIAGAGLTAVPVGSDQSIFEKLEKMMDDAVLAQVQELAERGDLLVDLSENREEELTWERLRWAFRGARMTNAAMNDSMVEDLVEYCRWWKPDLVIWDSVSYAGSIAATAVGAAHGRFLLGANVDGRMRRHFLRVRALQEPEDREDALAEWLGGWAEKYGAVFSEEMVTGHFTIDQTLGSMMVDQDVPRVAVGYVPYNGPAVVPDWLREDPPRRRVLATFGVSLEHAERHQALSVEQLREMVDALADLDIELVVTLPERFQEMLGRVPAHTRMVTFVPLHVVVPSCSAVIHHGGPGLYLDSIAHGVPQLMVSRVVPDIGERGPRTERAGAGLWIAGDEPGELSGARIRGHLVRLLDDPAFREGAGRLRAELLAQPRPAGVVRELETLTDRYRSRPAPRP